MILAQLTFFETVAAGTLNVLLTAVFVGGIATLLVKSQEDRAASRRQESEKLHEEGLQARQLEHQTLQALRENYKALLVAQRQAREAALELADAGGSSQDGDLAGAATMAHATFIDLYHSLDLDASRNMWKDARALRHILDDMLAESRGGNRERCEELYSLARLARQNLEQSFRSRLGHERLQNRNDLGDYAKD